MNIRLVQNCVTLALTAVLAAVSAAQGQAVGPHIGYVYPAGGRQGTSFEVLVGGQYLDGINKIYISGTGATAAVLEYIKPLTQMQFTLLRDKLMELQAKKAAAYKAPVGRLNKPSTRPVWTADEEKTLAEIRTKLATFVRRPSSPSIAETATLKVTFAPDAEPGRREIRVGTPRGLSNPMVFCVGQLPETSRPASKVISEQNAPKAAKFAPFVRRLMTGSPESEPRIVLPAVVNGQILPGAVDRYRFQARGGQRLVVAVSARELIPYLADAVPGWFQATLALYDSKGNELAYDDDFRFHPDPVLYYEIPRDGEYSIEIKDSIYRGREDFVYRITLGELPFVTGIFPLGGRAGEPTPIGLRGWNLPGSQLTEPALAPGLSSIVVKQGDLASNAVPFAVDTLPECLEKEPNDSPGNTQPVVLPIIVNGRIDRPGDCDIFSFAGHAGQKIVAEVYARRLDSPLDSVLKLTDAAGRQLAFNDDHEDKGSGLNTHHADSYILATLPADGTYYVHLGDVQHKGGPEYAYRLRLSEPRPDFDLRVTPSSVAGRAGAAVPLTVYALRRDGFAGEISLSAKDAPAGLSLGGARVPAGQDQVCFTLTLPAAFSPSAEPLDLHLLGQAVIDGRQVVHAAVPAEDMMQAFAYRHLVPAEQLRVAVTGRAMWRGAMSVLSPTPVKLPAGGIARIKISAPTRTLLAKIELELSEAPEGISIKSVSPIREGSELVLQADASKVKPGLKGNLILSAFAVRAQAVGGKAKNNRARAPLGTVPAIPFEVVAKETRRSGR